ncbi:NLR family CARD domain-containing protein 3-like [Strongylocentrotus purpuratus]|uniref:NACHT domain-containing protein n=1 Tax=Strongylocentrotus purpuratus TaxID=7668 RepID=A0A7M7NMC6_STRPU|nr:NLR family CARD domain-containing protein 3-like [Strongylocentrotus purpuratus]
MNKLIDLGVDHSIIPTICSFLSNRAQTVRHHGKSSQQQAITCGVPEGTCLGPVLLLVIINDAAVESDNRWKYVDDLTIVEVLKKTHPSELQSHLDSLIQWCKDNDVVPNADNCKAMQISFLHQPPPPIVFYINSNTLEAVSSIKLIGVFLQDDLKWDGQVSRLISIASRRLYLLTKLRRNGVTTKDLATIYILYIRGQTSRQTLGFDDVIIKVANAVSDDGNVMRLGVELGVQIPDINRALETNWAGGRKTSNGNVMLLQNWAETVKPSKQLPMLRAALQAVGFKEIEETCLQGKGEQGEMPDKVQRLREKLQDRYIEEFSEVKVSPMDPESRTWLQHIYVSLILMLGCTKHRYEDLFNFITKKTEKGFITRLAFLGEAGVGKSTLFAKIALDWAMGKCLQDITLLFHESFRDIEDSSIFGDIVMNHFPDDTEINGEWIDNYIKENQRKVLILLDGLDEAKMDIKCQNRKLAIVSIARRERFINTSVLISSRPFGADQIKSIPKIHEKYSYILVKGFTKENTYEYIKQYFKSDTASASSLIHFINSNSFVSEYMAPFPIFCCMLCYMWEVESKRKTTEKLQTISQLMTEIDFALREQYSSRYTDREGGYQCHMEKAVEAITKVGRVAFEGLLKNQLIFTKEEMEACGEAAAIACQVGILSGKKRLASKEIRQQEGKQFVQEFCFPHKLLQEHTASLYLASLFNYNRPEFNRILTHKLLTDYRAFENVLCFTAAHGGEVGTSVLEALCKNVDDMEFIIQCAFECHDTKAIGPVRNLLNTETRLTLASQWDSTPIAALFFTLEPIGKEVIEELQHKHADLGSAASSHYARGLCSMPKLRSLYLYWVKMSDEFYSTMATDASKSKVEELTHETADLGSAASSHYARGLCSMPNLRSLNLDEVTLSDEFYSTMADEASKSKIEQLKHTDEDLNLGSAASSHYARGLCSMPNLRSLDLDGVGLSDEFYSTMADEASKSKIEQLKHHDAYLGSAASSHYARGLCSMPNLRSLNLDSAGLSDEFYSTMAREASKSKTRQITSVDELSVYGKHVTSLWNLGLHTSCPRVQNLQLDWSAKENVSSNIVTMACSPFHHLTHLHIRGQIHTRLNDPMSFCKAVTTSCPGLTKLSINRIGLFNEKAAEIIQLMKTHPNLTSIELDWCCTNADLDPLIAEVNSEGKLTVTVKHHGVKKAIAHNVIGRLKYDNESGSSILKKGRLDSLKVCLICLEQQT